MYLHLGSDKVVFSKDVIGIFDVELAESPCLQQLLSRVQAIRLPGQPKALVLTDDKVIFVPLTRATLMKRWEKNRKRQESRRTIEQAEV